jgi:hypothetical protein
MRTLPLIAISLFAGMSTAALFAGCGSDDNKPAATPGGGDGGNDGELLGDGANGVRDPVPDCKPDTQACTSSLDCCSSNCVKGVCAAPLHQCSGPDIACTIATECCTTSCIGGKCSAKQCVADNGKCGNNAECCSGTCTAGICKPLNTTCKTSGNPCTGNDQCCSKLCNAGVCSDGASFCTQQGDVCGANFDCCGGNCTKAAGALLGTCGTVAGGGGTTECLSKGTLCVDTDSCGGSCCSRVCAPTGAGPGLRVCQPPSGCSPTGELCRGDSDCCGSAGSPSPVKGPVTCSKAAATDQFGRCDNGGACREPGSICKLSSQSCNAENNCCEPDDAPTQSWCNDNPDNCCRADALGIPRCILHANNCTTPVAAGTSCVTSADCCGKPCVGNKCQATCVNLDGTCTTHADCCTGLPCVFPTGSTKGLCGGTILPDGGVGPKPDAGTPPPTDGGSTGSDGGPSDGGGIIVGCALYGQTCAVNANCCDGVPCTNGTCHYAIK